MPTVEKGTIAELEANRGRGVIATASGKTIAFGYNTRHQAQERQDGSIQFTKQPRKNLGFLNQGDEVAVEPSPCGTQAERWGVIATNSAALNGSGQNGIGH